MQTHASSFCGMVRHSSRVDAIGAATWAVHRTALAWAHAKKHTGSKLNKALVHHLEFFMNRIARILSIAATVVCAHAALGLASGMALQRSADVAVMPLVRAENMVVRRAVALKIARAEPMTVLASPRVSPMALVNWVQVA